MRVGVALMSIPDLNTDRLKLWKHVYGEQDGYLSLFSGNRSHPADKRLSDQQTYYFKYSEDAARACLLAERDADQQREVYACAHLLRALPPEDRPNGKPIVRRTKYHAAPLYALYVDGDGAQVP